jgi:hypothetical protein
VTSNAPAEFGKQPGGSFNVITKSGTNRFEGTAAYFFRSKALNAHSWAANQGDAEKPDDKLTNLSLTLGGPIRRDRTFFFGSYMRFSRRVGGHPERHTISDGRDAAR